MSISGLLNILAERALIASDAAYFTNATKTRSIAGDTDPTHLYINDPLAPLLDSSPDLNRYLPSYSYASLAQGYFVDDEFTVASTGFKTVAFKNSATSDIILAFGGTDGTNATDWKASLTTYCFSEWDSARTQVFSYLNGLARNPDNGELLVSVNFTGQSLGGALAQYAAYEWVLTHPSDASHMTLTTFNALGGVYGLQQFEEGGYNSSVLAGLSSAANFVVQGDIVSRLGGGFAAGSIYQLSYSPEQTNPVTGLPYSDTLGLVDSHRIESGFYANLQSDGFAQAQIIDASSYVLASDKLAQPAALLGNLLNAKGAFVGSDFADFLAGLSAAAAIADPVQFDALYKAVLVSQHDTGHLNDVQYAALNILRFPTDLVLKAIGVAATPITLLGAGLADAFDLGLTGIQQAFSGVQQFLGLTPSQVPTPPVAVSAHEYEMKMLVYLSDVPGSTPDSNSLARELHALNVDPDALAQQLLSANGNTWRTETLVYLRDQLPNPADKVQTVGLTAAFYNTLSATPELEPSDLTLFAQERDAFILDTGSGFANAMTDFTQKITNVAFNLGQTISSFADIQLIDQAYAAELSDPRLSSSVRNVVEEARDIVQHAGQTVVVQSGIGANPFDTVGFDPVTAALATVTLKEEWATTFTAYLPYQAGTGGQSIQLTLTGLGPSTVTVLSGGQELTPVDGVVTLVIPEGEKELQFAVRARDLTTDATVALVAQLVDGTGVATHLEHQEATITAVNTPAIDYANGLTSQVWTGTDFDDTRDLLGAYNYEAHGNGGNDLIFSRAGNDQLSGDLGNDSLYGFVGHDQLSGGAGRDLLIADFRDDSVPPSGAVAGQDLVDGGAEDDVVAGGGGDDQLIGGTGNDHLWGDNLVEGDGAQPGDPGSGLRATYLFRVANSPGDDELDGGEGDDLLLGNLGDDVLLGGAGADKLFGDQVPGDSGSPVSFLETNGGADFLDGGDGHDLLQGDGGDDVLWGGAGNDQLYGDDRNAGAVTPGDDWLEGAAGDDLLVGGAGDDLLDGGADNDQLFGEEGTDVLDGGDGLDQLSGGIGNDDLYGGAGDDILAGHDGMDTLLGEAGADQLDGGNDNDELFGGTDNDVLFGQAGDDYLDGEENDDELQGGDGNDELVGDAGTDRLYGDGDGDTLFGDEGSDTLNGGAGADVLDGGDGVDQLTGGTGNDVLTGGAGSDTYVFNLGDGQDVLVDESTVGAGNQIQFGSGITLSSLTFVQDEANETLTIQVGGTADTIQLQGFSLTNWSPVVETLVFSNGTSAFLTDLLPTPSGPIQGTNAGNSIRTGSGNDVIHAGGGDDAVVSQAGNDALFGESAGDTLSGGTGNDWLNGGSGNDVLMGGMILNWQTFEYDGEDTLVGGTGTDILGGGNGRDTYLFDRGDGTDMIIDAAGEGNRLVFGAGIAVHTLTLEVDALRQLIIHTGSPGDEILFFNTGFGGFGSQRPTVDSVEFADGTVIDITNIFNTPLGTTASETIIGTSANDTIFGGGGNDTLIGGTGNDTLVGGSGATTMNGGSGNDLLIGGNGGSNFIFSLGSGQDTIQISDYVSASSVNVVQFAGGYDTHTPQLDLGSLVIRYGTLGDELHIVNFDPNDVFANPAVQRFEFTDRVLTYEELIALGFDVTGTSGDDVLTGTNTTDRFTGLAGDDQLSGGDGTDTFTGGIGNDTLRGGAGNDIYVFNLGDGIDTIKDTAVAGEGNHIQFWTGISQSDLTFTRNDAARTLTIQVGSSGTDQLFLTNFDPTGTNGSLVVETLVFADGSTVNLADLFSPIVNHAPTVATPLLDQTVPEDALFTLVVPSNTFADQDAGDTLTLSATLADGTALPRWLSFDAATATFSGTPDDAQVGTLDLRVTATDLDNLTVSDVFSLTVANVNEAPTVAVPLADQQATEDSLFNFVVPDGTFADVDAGDALIYSATLDNGAVLPTWLSFDPITHTFTGTPGNSEMGTLAVTVTATDAGNLSVSTGFSLSVQNVNDAPTVAAPIADQTAAEDSTFTFTVPGDTFADQDHIHGDVLTYGATLAGGSPLPAWLSFNPNSRTFSGTPSAGDAGSLQIAVTATDSSTLSANDTFTLTVSGPLPQTIVATASNDVLTGGRGDDTLMGLAGNDTLQGGQGHDLLDGGTGTDTMQGGTGNDTYLVDVSSDVVTEVANEGTDTVQSAISYTLGAHVEDLMLTGTANLNGTGNTLDNILTGNSGTNVLTGGAGNDTYIVGARDTVVENFNGGADTVVSAVTWTLGSNVEHLTLTGTANLNGTGNVLNNVLMGNSGTNTLDGGAGNDTVDGGDGNDSLVGGSGDDTLLGGLGTDVLNAGSGHDVLNGGDGTDTLDGGSGDDQLLGGAGNDALMGGSGADQLSGGTGNDTLTGDSGNELYNFSRGDGQDTIIDSDPFPGNQDRALFDATINPLDLVISRQANDLRLMIHGSPDQITVQNWYVGTREQIETIQAGNGQILLSTQVDQLIQAMAGFTQQTGLTWDQAIDQQPQNVQAILAASWQS